MQKKEAVNIQIKWNSWRIISKKKKGEHLFISITTKIFDGIHLPLYESKAPESAPSNAGPMTASSLLPELH